MNTDIINKKETQSKIAQSYLSFKLGAEHFAIHVMKIMEILEVPQVTKVPHAPDFLVGVINLRGAVLPVIDTRIKFGMSATEYTINTCIIVLHIDVSGDSVTVGALVDSVSEVFEMEESKMQPSPAIGARYKAEFIQGMIKENEKFMMLLDIDKVFSSEDLELLSENTIEEENKN